MIKNLTRQTTLATTCIFAQTPLARMKGLLGQANLPQGHALVITHCQSIHMVFMKFSLDVIFINKANQVVGLCRHIRPFQFSPIFFKSCCAIELSVGTIEASQTQISDTLSLNGSTALTT